VCVCVCMCVCVCVTVFQPLCSDFYFLHSLMVQLHDELDVKVVLTSNICCVS